MRVETPFLWFTQPLTGIPRPWDFFEIDGLMLNAYEALKSKSANKSIRRNGIHKYMKFEGPIAMDSGGFLFMKKGVIEIDPRDILTLYEESKPNFGVVLDYPITTNLSQEELENRLHKTLENTRIMTRAKKNSNPELIPVIHGHNARLITWYIKELIKIGEFNIFGIGSLVPSVFNSRGVGGIYNVVRIVSLVRRLLPEKHIHVFGIGSTLTMHLMFYAGADSIDSSSWRSKASFGAIQLPGTGDRYITSRKRHKRYPKLTREEYKILNECNCPACRREGIDGLKSSFTLRALHNAWVYQNEIEKTRKLIKNNEYEEYVEHIIGKSRFSKVLDVINRFKKKTNSISTY